MCQTGPFQVQLALMPLKLPKKAQKLYKGPTPCGKHHILHMASPLMLLWGRRRGNIVMFLFRWDTWAAALPRVEIPNEHQLAQFYRPPTTISWRNKEICVTRFYGINRYKFYFIQISSICYNIFQCFLKTTLFRNSYYYSFTRGILDTNWDLFCTVCGFRIFV